MQTNTNNVNKTWAFLQTTGGKDEPNIVLKHTYRANKAIFFSGLAKI